jgi:hypothetical protein
MFVSLYLLYRFSTQTTNGTEVNETTYDANNNRIIQKAYHDTSLPVTVTILPRASVCM